VSNQYLPDPFRDIEPFSAWALGTEAERNKKRLSSPMEEIQAFYAAMLPRLETVIGYLNQFKPDQMPEDARRLFHLVLSFAEVSPAVELFKQPGVVEGFDPDRLIAVHIPNMTPAEI